MEGQFSSESIVMIVCTAAIGALFAGCSAGLGWLLNRGVKQIDDLGKGHAKLKDDHGELKLNQAVLTTQINGHEKWLQDHEEQLNQLRQTG